MLTSAWRRLSLPRAGHQGKLDTRMTSTFPFQGPSGGLSTPLMPVLRISRAVKCPFRALKLRDCRPTCCLSYHRWLLQDIHLQNVLEARSLENECNEDNDNADLMCRMQASFGVSPARLMACDCILCAGSMPQASGACTGRCWWSSGPCPWPGTLGPRL